MSIKSTFLFLYFFSFSCFARMDIVPGATQGYPLCIFKGDPEFALTHLPQHRDDMEIENRRLARFLRELEQPHLEQWAAQWFPGFYFRDTNQIARFHDMIQRGLQQQLSIMPLSQQSYLVALHANPITAIPRGRFPIIPVIFQQSDIHFLIEAARFSSEIISNFYAGMFGARSALVPQEQETEVDLFGAMLLRYNDFIQRATQRNANANEALRQFHQLFTVFHQDAQSIRQMPQNPERETDLRDLTAGILLHEKARLKLATLTTINIFESILTSLEQQGLLTQEQRSSYLAQERTICQNFYRSRNSLTSDQAFQWFMAYQQILDKLLFFIFG